MAKPKRAHNIRISVTATELSQYHDLATDLSFSLAETIRLLLREECKRRGIDGGNNKVGQPSLFEGIVGL
jgi:hypothetical protein